MIHILNCEPLGYCDQARQILQSVGQLHEPFATREQLLRYLPHVDALILRLGFRIDREVLDAGKRLKAIATATTSLDHIDVEYAQCKGVTVLSLQGEDEFLRTVPARAEHTWALLLSLIRCLPWAFSSVLTGRWDCNSFHGHDLRGKRLGLVGLGPVGEKVAAYGQAFGMQVGAYDFKRERWEPGIERFDRLSDLLARSDVLSLHLPLNRETRRLIGAVELATLPPGALLINTSHGQVVDELALLGALNHGPLAGAALDMLSTEQRIQDWWPSRLISYARDHDNLLITPHIGAATVESMAVTEVLLARKLAALLRETFLPEQTGAAPAQGLGQVGSR